MADRPPPYQVHFADKHWAQKGDEQSNTHQTRVDGLFLLLIKPNSTKHNIIPNLWTQQDPVFYSSWLAEKKKDKKKEEPVA